MRVFKMKTGCLAKNQYFSEFIRFVLAGGFSFLVDLGALLFLQEKVFFRFEHGVFISTAIAFAISLCVHYFLTSFWVFRNHGINSAKGHVYAGVLFVVCNVIGLGLNELSMLIGVSLLGCHYLFVKVVASVIVMVWNYACQKLFIFKDKGMQK